MESLIASKRFQDLNPRESSVGGSSSDLPVQDGYDLFPLCCFVKDSWIYKLFCNLFNVLYCGIILTYFMCVLHIMLCYVIL